MKTRRTPGPSKRAQIPAAGTRPTARAVLPGSWQLNSLVFLSSILATVTLYAGDLGIGFLLLDDPGYVTTNQWIRQITFENLRHIFGAPYFANYSPLHLLSYMLDYALAGRNAFGFHLSSNIWAGIVAGFVFLVALALTQRRSIATVATVLFIVHPAHVEAVAWISSRKDLVAAAFVLPSFLAYLGYRKGRSRAKSWYALSLVLFLFAAAGKMSVAIFPGMLMAHDLFIEKRSFKESLIDKIPFVGVAVLLALIVTLAQPATGHLPNLYVVLVAFMQSLWLLTGFGTYVMYRLRPFFPIAGVDALVQLVAALLLICLLAAPVLFRRRWPMVTLLTYWILLALIPAQVLSFSHPVTDRYLFLPSVGAVILITWGVIRAGQFFGRSGVIWTTIALVALGLFWTNRTLAYLTEWQDVRSVWYHATKKTPDPEAYYNLGLHYQDLAARLGNDPRGAPLSNDEARRAASFFWANDPRLPGLLAEWSNQPHGGPIEHQFAAYLRMLAWNAFDQRARTPGNFSMPQVYLRRGLLLADGGDLQGARKEFLRAVDEAERFPFAGERQKFLVESHHALGVVASAAGDNEEALRWVRMAEEEQTRAGGNWVRDLTENRKRLEAIVGSGTRR